MERNLTTVKPLLAGLVKWTSWGVLAGALTVLFLYCAGSYRGAPDGAQLALVRALLFLSVLLSVASSCGIILDLWYALTRKNPGYLAGILGYGLLLAFGILTGLGAAFVLSAVGGNG